MYVPTQPQQNHEVCSATETGAVVGGVVGGLLSFFFPLAGVAVGAAAGAGAGALEPVRGKLHQTTLDSDAEEALRRALQ